MEALDTLLFTVISGSLIRQELKEINPDQIRSVKSPDDLFNLLLKEEAQVGVCPMTILPLKLPEGLVVTALSARYQPGFTLLISEEARDDSKLLNIKEGATVGCSSELQGAQVTDFRKDIQSRQTASWLEGIEEFKGGRLDAVLVPTYAVPNKYKDNQTFQFNPREFIPPSGHGLVGYITKAENKELRRQLKQAHKAESVEVNNLERKFKELVPTSLYPQIGVYCYIDANDFYHGNAVRILDGKVQYAQFSSGTTGGFAEELWKRIS